MHARRLYRRMSRQNSRSCRTRSMSVRAEMTGRERHSKSSLRAVNSKIFRCCCKAVARCCNRASGVHIWGQFLFFAAERTGSGTIKAGDVLRWGTKR